MKKRRDNPEGISPAPSEIIRSTEIAILNQIQEQIESAMAESQVARSDLAKTLGFTRAMIDHMLESPDVALRDLAALAAVLGISFRINGYRSGS